MAIQDIQARADLIQRLRRIEGQAPGVAWMIEEGRTAGVLQQLAAIRACRSTGCVQVLRSYTWNASRSKRRRKVAEALIRAIHQLT